MFTWELGIVLGLIIVAAFTGVWMILLEGE